MAEEVPISIFHRTVKLFHSFGDRQGLYSILTMQILDTVSE